MLWHQSRCGNSCGPAASVVVLWPEQWSVAKVIVQWQWSSCNDKSDHAMTMVVVAVSALHAIFTHFFHQGGAPHRQPLRRPCHYPATVIKRLLNQALL